jgi:hypothetical protein
MGSAAAGTDPEPLWIGGRNGGRQGTQRPEALVAMRVEELATPASTVGSGEGDDHRHE